MLQGAMWQGTGFQELSMAQRRQQGNGDVSATTSRREILPMRNMYFVESALYLCDFFNYEPRGIYHIVLSSIWYGYLDTLPLSESPMCLLRSCQQQLTWQNVAWPFLHMLSRAFLRKNEVTSRYRSCHPLYRWGYIYLIWCSFLFVCFSLFLFFGYFFAWNLFPFENSLCVLALFSKREVFLTGRPNWAA